MDHLAAQAAHRQQLRELAAIRPSSAGAGMRDESNRRRNADASHTSRQRASSSPRRTASQCQPDQLTTMRVRAAGSAGKLGTID